MARTTKFRSAGAAAVAKAVAERERWQAAALAAERDAAAAAALVPDSPGDLAVVGDRTVAAAARLDAARRALARAHDVEVDARRKFLHAIADDLAADRAAIERDARTLKRKIEPLLRTLCELDDVEYGPTPLAINPDGTLVPVEQAGGPLRVTADGVTHRGAYTLQKPRGTRFAEQARGLAVQEAVLRYVADRGVSPEHGLDLLGTAPLVDEAALQRAGLTALYERAVAPALPQEAGEYLAWLQQGTTTDAAVA